MKYAGFKSLNSFWWAPKDTQSLWVVSLCVVWLVGCGAAEQKAGAKVSVQALEAIQEPIAQSPVPGAWQVDAYVPRLLNKRVAVVCNHTALVKNSHLVDTLLSRGVQIVQLFAPEHGFRGAQSAGEFVQSGVDDKTGLPIISLYGKNKKPSAEQLAGVDVVVFDIQDVGARFYTYLSTLHYVMEAAAEQDLPVVVLDRPNPLIAHVAGPVMENSFTSFVGLHPVPVLTGMTIGEYAQMVNGEDWLKGDIQCELTVVPVDNYTRQTVYELPVAPSPNLPNMRAIYLYPSLCLFEGTPLSVGRGTDRPFQVVGEPGNTAGTATFVPRSQPGAINPPQEGKTCTGIDFSTLSMEGLLELGFSSKYLVELYANSPNQAGFFLKNGFFDKLAGTDRLRKAIVAGKSAEEIDAMWAEEVTSFMKLREPYLIYSDK